MVCRNTNPFHEKFFKWMKMRNWSGKEREGDSLQNQMLTPFIMTSWLTWWCVWEKREHFWERHNETLNYGRAVNLSHSFSKAQPPTESTLSPLMLRLCRLSAPWHAPHAVHTASTLHYSPACHNPPMLRLLEFHIGKVGGTSQGPGRGLYFRV